METTSTHPAVTAKSLAIKYALYWTGISLVLFLLVYYGAPQIMGTWMHSALQIIVGIGLAVYFTLDIRKQIGGYWSFKEALSSIFLLFVIPAVLMYFFSLAFGKWIEPEYPAKITEITLNATTEMMENITDNQEAIDKAIEETEKGLAKQFNPGIGDMAKSLGISILVYFIFALIWAAIFKRERPVFMTQVSEDDPDQQVDRTE